MALIDGPLIPRLKASARNPWPRPLLGQCFDVVCLARFAAGNVSWILWGPMASGGTFRAIISSRSCLKLSLAIRRPSFDNPRFVSALPKNKSHVVARIHSFLSLAAVFGYFLIPISPWYLLFHAFGGDIPWMELVAVGMHAKQP